MLIRLASRFTTVARHALPIAIALGAANLAACGAPATHGDAMSDTDAANESDAVAVTDASTDDVQADVPMDVPFMTAMHNPLPNVATQHGPTMSHIQLVIITYADDPNRAQLEAFGGWIGGSNWLTAVGADYGVGAGTLLGVVERTDNAPDAVTSTEIEAMITAGVLDGSILSPADHDYRNVLYMVFYPTHTTVSLIEPHAAPSTSCRDFGGYHSEARSGTLHIAYAAVPDCGPGRTGSDVAGETLAGSHEYIEAATDPFPNTAPGYQLRANGSTAWAFIGGEVGDLCELSHSSTQEAGYTVQRIWSNSAAAMDRDPCVPADPTRPFFNVSVDPTDVQFANAGDTVTFTLTGWTLVPMPDWQVSVTQQGGTLTLHPTLDTTTLNNGGAVTVTVPIPATAASGYATFVVNSSIMTPRNRQVWPIAIVIN